MFKNSELINEMDGLKRFAMKLTRNVADADDLVQSTILRAIEKKHLYKEEGNLFSWASKIMFNIFASQYRRKTKFESQYDPEDIIKNKSVDAAQEKKVEVLDVQDAMDDLSDTHREILTMVCINGMQYEDVANTLNVPVGTVRSRLSRARENLQINLDTANDAVETFKPSMPLHHFHSNATARVAAL